MVWTIAPAVSGAERRRVLTLHVGGLLAGALSMCFVLALAAAAFSMLDVGAAPPLVRASIAAVLLGWVIHILTRRGLPYPRSRWQVPEDWRTRLPLKATVLAYGFLLGLGALTDVVMPTYWLLVGLSLGAGGGFAWTVMAWLAYGAARAVVTLAGIRHYTATCAADGAPRSSAVRPEFERLLITGLTVLLFVSVASSQLVDLSSR